MLQKEQGKPNTDCPPLTNTCCCRRKENLQARSQGRVDKKKSKREKKLLKAGGGGGAGAGAGSGAEAAKKAPRAGFEGRRSTFIGGGKK